MKLNLRMLFGAVAILAVSGGCGNLSQQSLHKVETAEWSLLAEGDSTGNVDVTIKVDCPVEGNEALCDSIKLWIANSLGAAFAKQEMDELVRMQGRVMFDADSAEYAKEEQYATTLKYEQIFNFTTLFDNDEYVTISKTHYAYRGGAHGSYLVDNITFRRSDGHVMGWDLLANVPHVQLARDIKDGLKGYFEVETDEQLRDNLLLFSEEGQADIFSDEFFPMPMCPPYLVQDGIGIIYQQYEIACYAAGLPSCVLKYEIK